jgi:hypothetical protein
MQFNADRDKRIAQTKKDNLTQESAATKGPTGDTDWAKVNSMIDFTFKPPQEREAERERFKKLLCGPALAIALRHGHSCTVFLLTPVLSALLE